MDVWSRDVDWSKKDAWEWPVYRLAQKDVQRREEEAKIKERWGLSYTTGDHYTVFGLIGCEFGSRSLSFSLTAHAHFDKGQEFLSNICNNNNSVVSNGFTQAVVRAVCLSEDPICAIKTKLIKLQAIIDYRQRHGTSSHHLEWAAAILESVWLCVDANKGIEENNSDLLQKCRDMQTYFQSFGDLFEVNRHA